MPRHPVSVPDVVTDDVVGTLRHVMLVGGSGHDWSSTPVVEWQHRIDSLGGLCDALGVGRLTLRVYSAAGDPPTTVGVQRHQVSGCCVTIDSCGDGRQRFAESMSRLDPEVELSEKAVATALYGAADAEPDVVVVLGPDTQLPPSLVWELAYAELVFLPVPWRDFTVGDLEQAIGEYRSRRRRFGGLDDQ